jgi:hypothetical protein
MQSISPAKRRSHFDTALHIYGVQRKQLEEIKISFVVPRGDWKQFRNDMENYGLFLEFNYFDVEGQSIKFFGPIRGCVMARGTAEQNDELLSYIEAHPAFVNVDERTEKKAGRALNLVKNGSLASS